MAIRAYLGQGLKFPFEINQYGRIALQNDSALVKQSLDILFNEPLGTEFFREHYGSQIRLAQFEPNDLILHSLLDYYITDAIQKWERRIYLLDIKYTQPASEPDLISCTVIFAVKQSSEIDSFVFPFYRELKDAPA